MAHGKNVLRIVNSGFHAHTCIHRRY
jgi:hypothetical protein